MLLIRLSEPNVNKIPVRKTQDAKHYEYWGDMLRLDNGVGRIRRGGIVVPRYRSEQLIHRIHTIAARIGV